MKIVNFILHAGLMFFRPWAVEHIWNNLGHTILHFPAANYIQSMAATLLINLVVGLSSLTYANLHICSQINKDEMTRYSSISFLLGYTFYSLMWLTSFILVQFV